MRFLVGVACVTFGLLCGPACSGLDDPEGGPNAPCTRSSDCEDKLVCREGVCSDRNAPPVTPVDASADARTTDADGGS